MWILLLMLPTALAMQCSEITQVYQQSSCCTGNSDTCLRAIPLCNNVTQGKVCFDGSDVVVKGLDAFEFTENAIIFKKNFLPSQHNAFDFGNAEKKIRDIYEQD